VYNRPIIAMEKQMTDRNEQDGETQHWTRGTLESDCAVVVPASSTVFHHHPLTGVIRQNLSFSEMDSSADTEHKPSGSVTTKELETEVRRLQMEDHEDELDENGDM